MNDINKNESIHGIVGVKFSVERTEAFLKTLNLWEDEA
jgi:hypothetical protein